MGGGGGGGSTKKRTREYKGRGDVYLQVRTQEWGEGGSTKKRTREYKGRGDVYKYVRKIHFYFTDQNIVNSVFFFKFIMPDPSLQPLSKERLIKIIMELKGEGSKMQDELEKLTNLRL